MKDMNKLKDYRLKYKRYYGIDFGDNYVIHHIDLNHNNNNIKNLDIQTYQNIPNELTKLKENEIQINMNVFIPSLNQIGTILSLPNKDKKVQVQIGNTKIYFNIDKLEKTNKKVP